MAKKRKHKTQEPDVTTLYKIAGAAIFAIIIIGLIYAVVTSEKKEPAPMEEITTLDDAEPVLEEIEEPLVEPSVNETSVNASINQTINETNLTVSADNATINVTNATASNETSANKTAPANTTQHQTSPKQTVPDYSWDAITIEMPTTLTTVDRNKNSYHYFTIKEGDGTVVANDEQFKVDVTLFDPGGRPVSAVPTYENKQWLIRLLLTNPGTYQLTLTVSCADKQGHCRRLYGEGSTDASTTFQVV